MAHSARMAPTTTAVCGGVNFFTERLKNRLGLDYTLEMIVDAGSPAR